MHKVRSSQDGQASLDTGVLTSMLGQPAVDTDNVRLSAILYKHMISESPRHNLGRKINKTAIFQRRLIQ